MSSEDDSVENSPSMTDEEEVPLKNKSPRKVGGMRQRCRVANPRTQRQKEGSVSLEFLEAVQKLNEEAAEVESGVDVLADYMNVSNFTMDDDILRIDQITGEKIREDVSGDGGKCETVFSPLGYVDLRPVPYTPTWMDTVRRFQTVILTILSVMFYIYAPLSGYISGFIAGGILMTFICFLYFKLWLNTEDSILAKHSVSTCSLPIVKVPAIKEHQPLKKCEGWMNEYPEEYNPRAYHIAQTQSVYLRLQGSFLRISNTRQKIPKRAMWNESEHKPSFSSHRIYNLLDAKVSLVPEGLAKIRHWSKKYPICVTLSKDQLNVEDKAPKEITEEDVKKIEVTNGKFAKTAEEDVKKLSSLLNDDDEFADVEESEDGDVKVEEEEEAEQPNNALDWCDINTTDSKENSPDETHIYLFGRTDREKEDWYRRLVTATHKTVMDEDSPTLDTEYLSYMKTHKEKVESSNTQAQGDDNIRSEGQNLWVNALITRVMFDCLREEVVIQRLKERIQRKLASIRLPYFIQELNCEELSLGSTSPIITGDGTPELNDRGLWLDLLLNYEGLIVVILQTKVNLLRLKQPQNAEDKLTEGKSAIFHSDVDDSAESSTDDDSSRASNASVLDSKAQPGNRSKKLMKMVDRITESKIFQAATENRYIKKAMQDISNTDLRLKVEFKKCVGTLVLNIPPPPSDRLWLGFRTPPKLVISACPIVGERNINFLRVTSWIEKKIYKEFQKIFVIPNMEDLPIPVMSPKLPE